MFEILNFDETGYGDELLDGAFITVRLAVYSFTLSLLLGMMLSFVALSRSPIPRRAWQAYASVLMGVPSILVVFFIYYNAPMILKSITGIRFDVSPFAAGVSALSIVYSVYVGGVIRGAVLMVPPGQFDAARALGMPTIAIWWVVILPQVWRLALPGITNIWMVLLKDTALVSMVGLTDLVRMVDIAAAVTKKPFFFYFVAGFAYIIFSFVTMFAARRLELRLNRGQKFGETDGF